MHVATDILIIRNSYIYCSYSMQSPLSNRFTTEYVKKKKNQVNVFGGNRISGKYTEINYTNRSFYRS